MSVFDWIHEAYVFDRRTAVLADAIGSLIPANSRVLDIGCGDGQLGRLIMDRRPDVHLEGVDVLVRPKTLVPVQQYDGILLPYDSRSFDVGLMVDMLHHTANPVAVMREAVRVSRHALIIKDHLREGFLAGPTLLFMDRVGNARHGVSIPANYWRERRWRDAFSELRLDIQSWNQRVPLYPKWAHWLFGRSLHFVAKLGTAEAHLRWGGEEPSRPPAPS